MVRSDSSKISQRNGTLNRTALERAALATASTAALLSVFVASPALATTCRAEGHPQFGGSEPSLLIDADCTDPDYNERTFVIDGTKSLTLKLPDGSMIPYTEVKGHFPATRTSAQLPAGVTASPTTTSHAVTWLFPDKTH